MVSGASYHLIPLREHLHDYEEFTKPVEIAAASGHRIYAYGSGTLQVTTSFDDRGWVANVHDVYYAPEIHARLMLLGTAEAGLGNPSVGRLDGVMEHGWTIRRSCKGERRLS